jgi:hypothetical protein
MADQSPGGTSPSDLKPRGRRAHARPDARPDAREDIPTGHRFVVDSTPASAGGQPRLPVAVLGLAVVAIGALSAWGMIAGPAALPSTTPTPVAGVASSPPAAVAPPVKLALPAPDGDGLPSVAAATEDDAFAILATAGGWRQCPMWRELGDGSTIRPEDATAALAASNQRFGMHVVPDEDGNPRRFWVGGSEDDAARAFGGSAIVRVGDQAWTAISVGPGWHAVRLDPVALESDRLPASQLGAHVYPAPYCLADSVDERPAAVFEVPVDGDPLQRLIAYSGWTRCRMWQRVDQTAAPDGEAIDAAADASGLGGASGWVTAPVHADGPTGTRDVRLLIDPDPAHAASQHGSGLVVLGTGEPRRAWMSASAEGHPVAVSFDAVQTPAGRTAWVPTGGFAGIVGDCPGASARERRATGGLSLPPVAVPTVELLRGERTASALLRERLGWAGCRMLALEAYGRHIAGAAIDRAAADAGVDLGPLPIDGIGPGTQPVVVFLGDDVVDLARWAGVPIVALDGRPLAWLADETRADEWLPILTPAGRTAWMETGAAAWPDGGCEPPPDARAGIDGVRSLTCWTDRDRCVEAIEETRTAAPDAFTPSTEVAAGLGPGCPPNLRCAWTGPNDPVYVTAAPAGWTAADMVRAFGRGLRSLSGTSSEIAPHDVALWTLALASRPSAGLPVPDPVDEPAAGAPCAGEERRGTVRASPWDPRVAWVGTDELTWPAGWSAVFVPDLRLVGRDGQVVAAAGDEVRLVGAVSGVEGGRFVACAVQRVLPGQP